MSITFTGAKCVAEHFRPLLKGLEHEECWIATLNKDHAVIGTHRLAVGSVSEVQVSIRAILRQVLLDEAVSFVMVHRHPNGDPTPSDADTDATQRIRSAAKIVGLRLLDHVIVTDNEYFSFDESGGLTPNGVEDDYVRAVS